MTTLDSNPLPALPIRKIDSHKGDFGRALLIGGSRGMVGAIALSGIAALRSGAGLATLATAECCVDVVAGFHPSYMTSALWDDELGRIDERASEAAMELAKTATCVALGPGLGQSEALRRFVATLYDEIQAPMVVDADALNALAFAKADLTAHAPRVLTPHPGEFQRLLDAANLRGEQGELAMRLAQKDNLTIVLKGHRTLVTSGGRAWHNCSGNPGMATAGSGDVLTGMITAFVCQGLSAYEAARLGVYLHGVAGDLAATRKGMIGLLSMDICDHIPEAILQYQQDGLTSA